MMAVAAGSSSSSSNVKFTTPKVYDCANDFFLTFHLRPGPVIGKGVSGPVVYAKSFKDTASDPRAVKLFAIRKGNNSKRYALQEQRFAQEVSIMNALNHPNVMCQITAARCPKYFAISMKYCAKGMLADYIIRSNFTPDVLDRYVVQISCAVRYLHESRLYHGDIKLENILLDSNADLVLSDFGHSQILTSSSQMVSRVCGTFPYIAPEVDAGGEFDAFKLDAYALGVVLWCMLTNKNACRYHKLFLALLEREPFASSPYCPFAVSLLQEQPDKRWNVTELCQQLKSLSLNGSFTTLL